MFVNKLETEVGPGLLEILEKIDKVYVELFHREIGDMSPVMSESLTQ